MKFRIFVLTLLVMGLVFAFASTSMAVGTVTIKTEKTSTVAAGDSIAIGSWTVTADASTVSIASFQIDGAASTHTPLDVVGLDIYEDVNSDGLLDSGDIFVIAASAANIITWEGAGALTLTPATPIPLAATVTKDYIVVVSIAKVGQTVTSLDTKVVTTTFGVTEGSASVIAPIANVNNDLIAIEATHLQFVNAGTAFLLTQIKSAEHVVTHDTDFIYAVDDYGNLDVGFDETVLFSAENMMTGADLTDKLTIQDDADGDMDSINKTLATVKNVMAAGVIKIDTGAGSDGVKSIKINDAATTPTPTTIVAKTGTTNLVGSVTLNSTLYRIVNGANTLTLKADLVGTGGSPTETVTASFILTAGYYTAAGLLTEIDTKVGTALDLVATGSTTGDEFLNAFTPTWSSGKLLFTMTGGSGTGTLATADLTVVSSTAVTSLGFVAAQTAHIDAAGPLALTATNTMPLGYPTITGIVTTRGIEVYDTDHNGYIDHATMIFNTPVAGSPNESYFSASGYTVSGVEGQNYDAGGKGIRNVGEYGYTIVLTEKTEYDTATKPQVQYIGNTLTDKTAATNLVPTVNDAQAVEVDRARPVLISAVTKDSGIGLGLAANGRLDGLVFTFSEPVVNYKAGADSVKHGLYIDPSAGLSFNQGNGTIDGSVLTIPVGETTINTGDTPIVIYNIGVPVTDSATSSTGATSPNSLIPDKNDNTVETYILTTDGAPMVVYQVLTKDLNADVGNISGRIDQIWVTFSETPDMPGTSDDYAGVQFYSDVSAFSSGATPNGIYDVNDAGATIPSGATIPFKIMEVTVAGVYDTEALPNFQYNPDADYSDIKDLAGNELAAYGPSGLQHETTVDGAKGVVVKMITRDAFTDTTFLGDGNFFAAGANGRIDGVELVFSEQMITGSGAQNGGTALNNVIEDLTFKHAGTTAKQIFTLGSSLGKPSWTDTNNNGDTSTTIKLFFAETAHDAVVMVNKGDTGLTNHTMTVAAPAAGDQLKDVGNTNNLWANSVGLVVVDGAAPFLVDGIGKYWGDDAFANVATNDSTKAVKDNVLDTANGDGYIDGFKLKFSEVVTFKFGGTPITNFTVQCDSLKAFTVDLPGDGALSFDEAHLNGNASNTVTLYGLPDFKGSPDTDKTPALTFTGGLVIVDNTGNLLAPFEDKLSADGAAPVIVSVNGGAAPNLLNIKFSEPVTGYYTGTDPPINAPVDSLSKTSTTIFGYENLSTGIGATAFTSAYVTYGATQNILVATLNANLTPEDIESDLVWVRTLNLYDNANAVDSGLSDNFVISSIAGSNIKVIIFDDVVAPWISAAKTLDIDGDGLIDHIRFELSENIDDSSIKGYVSDDAMSTDVSATWKVGTYTGTAHWNFFRGNKDAGKLAAAAVSKPAFTDNAADDNVLYLELDEALVPTYSVTGLGSTGFAPTVTWGTAANAVTLSDFRPNVLNTTADPDDTTPEAVNGVVTDAVGPVIMLAEYAAPAAAKVAAETGGTVTLYFSEPVVIADPDTPLNTDDFYFSGDAVPTDIAKKYIWANEWVNAGTLALTFKSSYTFATSAAPSVQIAVGTQFEDAAENVALARLATLGETTATARADWFDAVSPMNVPPYKVKTAAAKGVVAISGLPWLDYNKTVIPPSTSAVTTVTAGEPVDILWTSSNVENVDLYISFNSGQDWRLVEGSTTPAADLMLTWTPQLNVTNIKLVAAEDATINSGSCGLTIVNDFNQNNAGSTIGAASELVLTDVSPDNGHWMFASFMVSPDHLTSVKSYQFYRERVTSTVIDDTTTVVDSTWVYSAIVQAGLVDANNKQTCLVPSVINGEARWAVVASTGDVLAMAAVGKAADMPVAMLVDGTEKAAATELSGMAIATGGSIDNLPPSAIEMFKAADNVDPGILLTWTAPLDHGIVGTYGTNGVYDMPIYGVDSYEVYRRIKGDTEWTLLETAGPGSASFVDMVDGGSTVYNYYVKAVDDYTTANVDAVVKTAIRSAIATSAQVGDFTGDGTVGPSDFAIFATNYNTVMTTDPGNWVTNYDLNSDDAINSSDFAIFGTNYGSTLVAGKAIADMPTSEIPLILGANVEESTSMYFVNVNVGESESLKGLTFALSYDKEALEFVPNSVSGLVGLDIVRENEEGIIEVSNWFVGNEFDGTITLGFKSNGLNRDVDFEVVNAMVDDVDGLAIMTNVSDVTVRALPTVYSLSNNYPNPFNPTTTIDYSIPKSGNVELVIFNIAGQKVRTLVNENQNAAFYKVVWDGLDDNSASVASGMYIYRIVSGNFSKIEKMMLMK